MGLRDSISATHSRIKVLRRTLLLRKSKREEYAKTISQRLQALSVSKDNAGKVTEDKSNINEAGHELPTHSENLPQETSIISALAPALSIITDTIMSTPENKVSKVQVNKRHKKSSESPLLSPAPTSSARRSARLKGFLT